MGYEASAHYYDLFGEKPDIPYYKKLGETYRKAAELGVGTARVALELAKAGVRVWGIDTSENMLEMARSKIAQCPEEVQERITLLRADMTDFSLPNPVSLIYIPSSGLSHCITPHDLLTCLHCIYDQLEPGGLLAFDLILPSEFYNSSLTQAGIGTYRGKTIVRWIANRVDFSQRILHTTLIFEEYTDNVLGNQILEQSTVGLIYKKDLLSSLEKTGFDVESLYGDFNGSSTVTDLLIVEARKPKSF
jgi:ubiquinone/menaquinone biosynthesis C-methylase UbiE